MNFLSYICSENTFTLNQTNNEIILSTAQQGAHFQTTL